MHVNPAILLFGNYRREVLGLLLLRPEDSLHVREISRLTGVPAGSLHRELRSLTDAELLLREPQGNQIRYRANRASPIFPELAGIFRKTAGLADVLRDAFAPIVKSIELAFVFGSVAKGEESAASDVDIFVLGNAKYQDVVTATAPLRERLGRNANPVVMTRKQFASLCKARDRFIQRVSSEPKIFIFGAEDDLG